MAEMTSRERVLTAARRQVPDRVPRTMPIERGIRLLLVEHFGTDDLFSAMRMDMAGIGPNPTAHKPDLAPYFSHPDATWGWCIRLKGTVPPRFTIHDSRAPPASLPFVGRRVNGES